MDAFQRKYASLKTSAKNRHRRSSKLIPGVLKSFIFLIPPASFIFPACGMRNFNRSLFSISFQRCTAAGAEQTGGRRAPRKKCAFFPPSPLISSPDAPAMHIFCPSVYIPAFIHPSLSALHFSPANPESSVTIATAAVCENYPNPPFFSAFQVTFNGFFFPFFFFSCVNKQTVEPPAKSRGCCWATEQKEERRRLEVNKT